MPDTSLEFRVRRLVLHMRGKVSAWRFHEDYSGALLASDGQRSEAGRARGHQGPLGETLLLKHQLLVINRARRKAPTLKTGDRILMGFWSLF